MSFAEVDASLRMGCLRGGRTSKWLLCLLAFFLDVPWRRGAISVDRNGENRAWKIVALAETQTATPTSTSTSCTVSTQSSTSTTTTQSTTASTTSVTSTTQLSTTTSSSSQIPILPARVSLLVEFAPGTAENQTCDSLNCREVFIPAGLEILTLQLRSPDAPDYDWGSQPQLLIARDFPEVLSTQSARTGGCAELSSAVHVGTYLRLLPAEWGDHGVDAVVQNGQLDPSSAYLPLVFREGGDYSLCFSEDATFVLGGRVDLVPIKIRVRGAYDSTCTNSAESPCIAARSQYCHILQGSYSPAGACAISFDQTPQQGVLGTMEQMRISWSDPWQVTYSSSGAVLAVQNLSCQSRSPEVSEFLCLNADRCDLGDDSVPLSSQALASLPRARGDLLGNESFKAYTIRVCLCPIVGNCLQPEFFVQEVGIVHFFAAYLCLHPGDAESEDRCLGSFSAAAAFYPIQIHVHCPSDVCKLVPDTAGSRLKLTSPSPDNFRPSWDPTTGCRTAFQTPLQTQPANCIDPSYCVLSGGTREDLKSFGGGPEGPFQFLGDRPLHGRRTFHSAVSFDICFCLSDCRSTLTVPSYFKVGEMSIVPLRLLGPSLLLQVPRRVGVLRLQRVEADIISFQPPPQSVPPAGTEEAYVKLLADDAHQVHDRECGLMPYASYINQSSPEFHLLSISSNDFAQLDEADGAVEAVIRARFRGEPDLANTSHLVFNESLMFLRPGRVAVCYCGVDVAGACRPSFWRLLTHLTVRGPKLLRDLAPYQRWTVSPDVVFSLELLGWGLVATDQILILQPGASCVDDVPSIEDSILRSCPRNCSRFHDGSNGSTPGVALHVLSDSSVPCGGAAEDLGLCPHVFVEAVEVAG